MFSLKKYLSSINFKLYFGLFVLITFCISVLAVSLRGEPGNPMRENMNEHYWKDEGPFELSPERGRFALMYSLLEDKSFQFSTEVAQFASPDVAYANGQFVSLFAPALSYMIMPGYILGKAFGLSQLGSYAVISFFAVLNMLLIRAISVRMGANQIASVIASLLFLFASPGFAYAVSLYQHHASTFLILSSIYVLIRFQNKLTLTYVWLACAFSVMLDNPNVFFMLPIGLFAFARFFKTEKVKDTLKLHIQPLGFITLLIMILPILAFGYINLKSYGSPYKLAGTSANASIILKEMGSVDVDVADLKLEDTSSIEEEEGEDSTSKVAVGFFKTRNILNGLYIHLVSLDRGTVIYTPVMLVGLLGFVIQTKQHQSYKQLLMAVIGVVVLVYSMWGDPYGGWAFGSRYMIPVYALLSIGLALVLTQFRHRFFALLFIAVLGGYSIYVNTIGALTTNRIPPKVQVLSLEETSGVRQRYTFTRGMEMLNENRSKSFVFQTIGKSYSSAWEYAVAIMAVIGAPLILLLAMLYLSDKKIFPKVTVRLRKTTK